MWLRGYYVAGPPLLNGRCTSLLRAPRLRNDLHYVEWDVKSYYTIPFHTPQFTIAGNFLQFVKVFKYLGHVITDTLSDDDDLQREIRSLFTRTNTLARRFAKCSRVVKIALFKAYCICLYDAGLRWRYKSGSFNKLSSCYNKCRKIFFGYKRRDSVTQILFDLGLPSFDTIVHNSKAVLSLSWSNSCNAIVNHIHSLLALL